MTMYTTLSSVRPLDATFKYIYTRNLIFVILLEFKVYYLTISIFWISSPTSMAISSLESRFCSFFGQFCEAIIYCINNINNFGNCQQISNIRCRLGFGTMDTVSPTDHDMPQMLRGGILKVNLLDCKHVQMLLLSNVSGWGCCVPALRT